MCIVCLLGQFAGINSKKLVGFHCVISWNRARPSTDPCVGWTTVCGHCCRLCTAGPLYSHTVSDFMTQCPSPGRTDIQVCTWSLLNTCTSTSILRWLSERKRENKTKTERKRKGKWTGLYSKNLLFCDATLFNWSYFVYFLCEAPRVYWFPFSLRGHPPPCGWTGTAVGYCGIFLMVHHIMSPKGSDGSRGSHTQHPLM